MVKTKRNKEKTTERLEDTFNVTPVVTASPEEIASGHVVPANPEHEAYFVDIHDLWKNDVQPWAAGKYSSMAIRFISRGLAGAAAYAVGDYLVDSRLRYKHDDGMLDLSRTYDPTKGFQEQHNWVQKGAWLYDQVGRPLEKLEQWINPNRYAEFEANHQPLFGPDRYGVLGFANTGDETIRVKKTLGADAMLGTLGFAFASFFDALARKTISLFDPHAKKSWLKDGRIDVRDMLKTGLKTSESLIMAPLEDFAVAIPYTYQKRLQRHLIDKYISPGFSLDPVYSTSGATFEVRPVTPEDGGLQTVGEKYDHIRQTQGADARFVQQINERISREGGNADAIRNTPLMKLDRTKEGAAALDFQIRFTGYNIMTLMFRESVAKVKSSVHNALFSRKQHEDYIPPKASEAESARRSAPYQFVRWFIRDIIKGTIYMTPAVPFFSALRVTQKKAGAKALLVEPHEGQEHALFRGQREEAKAVFNHGDFYYAEDKPLYHVRTGPMDYFWNFSNTLTRKPAEFVDSLVTKAMKNLPDDNRFKMKERRVHSLAQSAVAASTAYTPYMIAKAATADRWDTAAMNHGIEQVIDGVFSLKPSVIRQGAVNMRTALKNRGSDVHAIFGETKAEGYNANDGVIVRRIPKPEVDELEVLERKLNATMEEAFRGISQDMVSEIERHLQERANGQMPTPTRQSTDATAHHASTSAAYTPSGASPEFSRL